MPARRSRRIVRTVCGPRGGFVVGELRGGVRAYALVDGGVALVRHRSRDIDLVVEIFGPRRASDPPASLAPRLRGPLRVLDLGGNIGLFAGFALQRYDVRAITSFEPDPENA